MPWNSGPSFADAHNHKLKGSVASTAARMATAMVNSGVPEGIAIATANKHGNEMMAAAMRIARQKFDGGGAVSGGDIPWFSREEARGTQYGFNAGFGAGRNDKNNQTLGASSYVLPADVVAGLGDGNSLAGAHIFDMILHSMPYGITAPESHRGMAPPRPPSLGFNPTGPGVSEPPISPSLADGGMSKKDGEPTGPGEEPPVEVITADGEILVSPRDVARIGARYSPAHKHADYAAMQKKGLGVLDSFTKAVRGRTIRHLASLPGPKGSKNASVGHV